MAILCIWRKDGIRLRCVGNDGVADHGCICMQNLVCSLERFWGGEGEGAATGLVEGLRAKWQPAQILGSVSMTMAMSEFMAGCSGRG